MLQAELTALDFSKISTPEVAERYRARIAQAGLLKTENPTDHFCAYFLPQNPQTHEIFIIHHKKARLWLAPGGHLDPEESLREAVVREIREELGVELGLENVGEPFLATITEIDNPPQVCRRHYDIWFLYPSDGSEFKVDWREFHQAKWVSLVEAEEYITDPSNLLAVKKLQDLH